MSDSLQAGAVALLQRPTEALSASEFRQLAAVPPEVEWFANLRNPNTRKAYQTDIRDFSTYTSIREPQDFRRVTRAHVVAWRDELVNRELSASTIRRKLAALSSLYAYLSDRNAVEGNPVAGVSMPTSVTTTGEGTTPAISAAQARVLLEAPDPNTLKGKRDRAILATLLYHGIGREELVKLRVKDVHEREGVPHPPIRGKRGKTRHLPAAPVALRRTLTWDRGKEMGEHARFTVDTGVRVFFCDPRSPWQRGSNENTNGLLRQYFPKGTDLAVHDQSKLEEVADSLNTRPRQTLGWKTPAEAYAETVAMTD